MSLSRSQITAAVNNDKTGYSLTAGSYSTRASSTQRGTVAISAALSGTASISSVTLVRAIETWSGQSVNANDVSDVSRVALTAVTTVTANVGTSSSSTTAFVVQEDF